MKQKPVEALETLIEGAIFFDVIRRMPVGQVVLSRGSRFPTLKDLKSDDIKDLAPHHVKRFIPHASR
jgi:hypothetical protein